MTDRLGFYALTGRSKTLEEKLRDCDRLNHVEDVIEGYKLAGLVFTQAEWALVLDRQKQLGGGR